VSPGDKPYAVNAWNAIVETLEKMVQAVSEASVLGGFIQTDVLERAGSGVSCLPWILQGLL
jgi:hypothetical protein